MTIHRARLGAREFRVIRPAGAPLHASLRLADNHHTVYASSGAAMRIAAFWEIAARSPHTLVHVPLHGDGTAPRGWHDITNRYPAHDLLLAPQRMRFPRHEWKRLRARLGQGSPATFTLPPNALDSIEERALDERWNRENTRRLDLWIPRDQRWIR